MIAPRCAQRTFGTCHSIPVRSEDNIWNMPEDRFWREFSPTLFLASHFAAGANIGIIDACCQIWLFKVGSRMDLKSSGLHSKPF